MAEIGDAIYNILSNDANVSGVVSNRIYPYTIVQRDALPAITYSVLSNNPADDKSGVSGMDDILVDIDMFGVGYRDTADLANKVRTALDRVSGTYASVKVDSIQFRNQVEQHEEIESDLPVYHITQEYKFRIRLT